MKHSSMITLLATIQPGLAGYHRGYETARVSFLLVLASLGLGMNQASAQGVLQRVPASARYLQLDETVMTQAGTGRLADAETALFAVSAASKDFPEPSCAGLIISNMALLMAGSGRLAEAESFAERSVTILEQSHPAEDSVLL